MKHFISFVKRKGLYLTAGEESNNNLVHQINHQLMTHGYIMTKDLFDRLSTQSEKVLNVVYSDIVSGIERVVGGDGHEPIYRNFPQSVLNMSYREFAINAVIHYWSLGTWRPEDAEYLNREFKIEPVDYKEVGLIEKSEFNSIFTDIIYSGKSISKFDKEIVDYFLKEGTEFDFGKITFKETASYIGKTMMNLPEITKLPTKDATQVLRIWSAYSGGDEGLKENTKFKNPNARQRKVLLNTLNESYNLEDSFKTYREKWLRMLYFLHPMTGSNKAAYPEVSKYSNLLRNEPKTLKTFNARVEEGIANKDEAVFDLLAKRRGMFTRRLDHLVRVFGYTAFEKWLATSPNLENMITAYNHFTNRDKEQAGRGAVLASQNSSEVVTYDALKPLAKRLVTKIKKNLMESMSKMKNETLSTKKVFIDKTLYYRPLAVNNRATSLSLDGAVNGTVVPIPENAKTIRMYVHWEGSTDIDLSGMLIDKNNGVTKIGWNARHLGTNGSVVYSGDNTGYSAKNAEYLDITPSKLASNVEWVIVDAVIFRGPTTYSGYNGKARAGWMLRDFPQANSHWLPETLQHSMVLNSNSRSAYLLALHVPSNSLVYLDLSMGNNNVTTNEDALKMRMYLDKFVTSDANSESINWDVINQGHLLNLLANEVVENADEADISFTDKSTYEEVVKYMV